MPPPIPQRNHWRNRCKLKHAVPPSISELAPGDRRVLNENEVANRWGVSPKTLQRWRSEGRGPKYLKLSKRVGYPLESVIDFERRVLHDSTYQHASA